MKRREDFLPALKKYKLAIEQSAKSENIVLVLGDTGVGKSTLINHMMGLELMAKRLDNSKALVIECTQPLAVIGHDKVSQTSIPASYRANGANYSFWDCPGFEDTGGSLVAIINAYSISQISKLGQNFQFLAVIEERSLKAPIRGAALRELLFKLGNMLKMYDYKSFAESFLFCFTKASGAILDHQVFLYDLIAQMGENGISFDESLKSFLQLIVDNKQFVIFDQPEDEGVVYSDIQNEIQDKLSSIKSLSCPELSPALSTEAGEYLKNNLIKYFQAEVDRMIFEIVEKISIELEEKNIEQSQHFAFNKFLPVFKAYHRETKNSEVITGLEKLLGSWLDKVLVTKLSDLKFILTEVFEFLSYKILGVSRVESDSIDALFDNIALSIEKHFTTLSMSSDAELFHLLINSHLPQIDLLVLDNIGLKTDLSKCLTQSELLVSSNNELKNELTGLKTDLSKLIQLVEKTSFTKTQPLGSRADITSSELIVEHDSPDGKANKQNDGKSSWDCCCNIYTLAVIYDNPILNHPNVLKAVSRNLGISASKVIDISAGLDKEFLQEVCEIGNVDLLQDCFY